MSWPVFHFNCRFLAKKLNQNVSLNEAKQQLIHHYGEYKIASELSKHCAERRLYDDIFQEIEPETLKQSLVIYGGINLSWDLSAIVKLKNIKNYVLLLFAMFIICSSIFKYLVFPAYAEIFFQMDIPITSKLLQLEQTLPILILVLMCLATILFANYFFIHRISQKMWRYPTSALTPLFISKRIVNSFKKIDALTYAPLAIKKNEFTSDSQKLIQLFIADQLDVVKELQGLLDQERATLIQLVNRRLSLLLLLFSTTLVIAIAYLVFSYYEPLFSLGMII